MRSSGAARTAAGAPVTVCLVPARSLIVTSSGKLSRASAKQKFMDGGFDRAVTPGRAAAVAQG